MRIVPSVVLGSLVLSSSVAHAERVDLFVFENDDGVDVSGLDIWVDVAESGEAVELVFHNDSTIDSFVSSIYVEGTAFSEEALSGGAIASASGASFAPGAKPPNPPGAIAGFGGAWAGNLFSADKAPGKGTGIDPSDSLTLEFDLADVTFSEVLAGLEEPEFRFVAHVQGIGEASVWATNSSLPMVPLPPAAGLGLAGLGLIGAGRLVTRRG